MGRLSVATAVRLSKIPIERNGFKPSLLPEILVGLHDLTVGLNNLSKLLICLDDVMQKQKHDPRKQ